MSEELVTLARKDGHLVGLWSAVEKDGEAPPRFALAERRPRDARDLVPPASRRAFEAWSALGGGRLDEAQWAASAMVVLLETVPLGDAGSDGAARQWLCRPSAWSAVRRAARAQAGQVVRLLRAAGYDERVAATLDARDPYVAYHHGAPDEPGTHALPPRFRAFALPLLRSRPWADVRRALAIYWALDLHRDDALLALAVRLLARGGHGLGWLELLVREQPSRRDTLGRVALKASAADDDPSALLGDTFEVLSGVDEDMYEDRLTYVLLRRRRGTDPRHLRDAVNTATTFAPTLRFTCTCHGRLNRMHHRSSAAGPTAALWTLFERFQGLFPDGLPGAFAIDALEWNAKDPSRDALLARASLRDWPALTSYRMVLALVYDDAPGWSDEERLKATERALAAAPPSHQAKSVDALATVLETMRPDAAGLAIACALVARMARPPFRSHCDSSRTVALLMEVAGAQAERLAQVSDRSLQRLERALCEDQDRLHEGLRSLGRKLGELAIEALITHPEPLIAAARHLGLLKEAPRTSVLKRFRSHPVMDRRFARRPLDRVCRTLEALVRQGLPNPIPRKLRDHREGRVTLSPASLEGHRQAIVQRLLPFRLQLLRRLALEEVSRSLPVDLSREAERHAVQMLGSLYWSRRLLRRVLRVAPPERRRFLDEHPRSRAWHARHCRVDQGIWREGVSVEESLADGRRVRLAFETDPAEVLRLGTHVGSCLSVGGIFSSSAVAVMVDANRRVVFARDARGAFVARQQIAITEDERVFCFPVYPLGVPEDVAAAFERYDVRLASALGLELERDGQREVEIAPVLAGESYLDELWPRLAPLA